jgi:putative CocE/NonD family hydrolase
VRNVTKIATCITAVWIAGTAALAAADPWPEGLSGPFELAEVRHVFAPMSDGTLLEGWIGLPDLPDGVGAPTLVSTSPYYGYCPANLPGFGPPYGCQPTPGDPAWWTDESLFEAVYPHWGMAPVDLVREGYAVAFFSVRGTGSSGGCFDWYGPRTRRDHGELVEWLAAREWSSGRVGAGGLSLPAVGAELAAVEAPEALRAVVIAGVLSDLYTFHRTPQGAQRTLWPVGLTNIATQTSFTGFARADDPAGGLAGFLAVAPERLCDDTADVMTQHVEDVAVADRDAAFYDARRLADDLGDVEAAVLLAQGYFDGWVFEDDSFYGALESAPRRRITGPWPHQFPTADATTFPGSWDRSTWPEIVVGWLDHWVKGVDTSPRVGVVDYQDLDGTWRSSAEWPPERARDEVLYLVDGELQPTPGEGSESFLSAPNLWNSPRGANAIGFPYRPHAPLCEPEGVEFGTGLVYVTAAAAEPVTIAGMPHLWIRLSSTLPHGLLEARFGRLRTDFGCDSLGQASGWDAPVIHPGAADLRFHAGNRDARPFPVDAPTQVRIDLSDLAVTLEPGERLVIELSYGETHADFVDRPPYPTLTVHAGLDADASHLVLPVVEGTLGGDAPTVGYPARPFAPGWTEPEVP